MENTCQICSHLYDEKDHVPKVLPVCGHTFCQFCIEQFCKEDQPRCPLDRLTIPSDPNQIPLNYSLISLIKPVNDLCSTHKNKKAQYYCKTDKKMICDICVCDQKSKYKHVGHEVFPISELENKIAETKLCIRQSVDTLKNTKEDLITKMDEIIENEQHTLNYYFQKAHDLLNDKKRELNVSLTAFGNVGYKKIKTLLDPDSGAQNKLHEYQKELNSMKTEKAADDSSLLEKMSEEALSITRQLRDDNSQSTLQKGLETSLHTSFHHFFKAFAFGLENICRWNFSYPDIGQYMQENLQFMGSASTKNDSDTLCFLEPKNFLSFSLEKQEVKVNRDPESTPFVLGGGLEVKLKGDICLISMFDTDIKEACYTPIDLPLCAAAQELRIEFDSTEFESFDIQSLILVWQRLDSRIPKLYLSILPPSMSDFPQILDIIEIVSPKCNSLTLQMKDCTFESNEEIYRLFEALNLFNIAFKELNLYFSIKLPSSLTFLPFQADKILDTSKLTTFCLDLSDTEVDDSNLSEIFIPMPAVNSYTLNLKGTNFSGEGLVKHAQITLSSMTKLQHYSLNASGSLLIESDDMKEFFRFMPKLLELELLFNETTIDEDHLFPIINYLFEYRTQLRSFTIGLSESVAGSATLNKLFGAMPNCQTFGLDLSKTNVDSHTYKNFAKKCLGSMKKLKNLKLDLTSTSLTDKALQEILCNVPSTVTHFVLNVSETVVCDSSLTNFIEHISSKQKMVFSLQCHKSKISNEMETRAAQFKNSEIESL